MIASFPSYGNYPGTWLMSHDKLHAVRVIYITSELSLQLWMMRGQIEEQQGNMDVARDSYNAGVSEHNVAEFVWCMVC